MALWEKIRVKSGYINLFFGRHDTSFFFTASPMPSLEAFLPNKFTELKTLRIYFLQLRHFMFEGMCGLDEINFKGASANANADNFGFDSFIFLFIKKLRHNRSFGYNINLKLYFKNANIKD